MDIRTVVRSASVSIVALFCCILSVTVAFVSSLSAATPDDGLWMGRTDDGHVMYLTTDEERIQEIGIRYTVHNDQCSYVTTINFGNYDGYSLKDGQFDLEKEQEDRSIAVTGTFSEPDSCSGSWYAVDDECGWSGEGLFFLYNIAGDVNSAAVLDPDVQVEARLDYPEDIDVYDIVLPSGGELIAYTSGDTDTFGILFGESLMRRIDFDDDSGLAGNFRISESLNAGQYYLVVVGYDEDTTGDYDLFVNLN